MVAYSNVNGLSYSLWEADEDKAVLEQDGCKVEELYYDEDRGNLVLTFIDNNQPSAWVTSLENGGYMKINRVESDKDSSRLHSIDIPIKAASKWNKFVDSLPKTHVPSQ